MSKLVIAGREFNSRLFLGTGKFNNNDLMARAIEPPMRPRPTTAIFICITPKMQAAGEGSLGM